MIDVLYEHDAPEGYPKVSYRRMALRETTADVLDSVVHAPVPTVQGICSDTGRPRTTVHAALGRLEYMGLIRHRRIGRTLHYYPTADGCAELAHYQSSMPTRA